MGLLRNVSRNTKLVVTTIVGIVSVFGSVWAIDDRYVDQQEIVATLQQYDASIQQRMANYESGNNLRDYNHLTESYYRLRRLLRQNPGDQELREEFDSISNRRLRAAEKLGL
jgi:hypothetical protein